jgi:hypothetical protein
LKKRLNINDYTNNNNNSNNYLGNDSNIINNNSDINSSSDILYLHEKIKQFDKTLSNSLKIEQKDKNNCKTLKDLNNHLLELINQHTEVITKINDINTYIKYSGYLKNDK